MVLPNYTTQTASEYKTNIDAEIAKNASDIASIQNKSTFSAYLSASHTIVGVKVINFNAKNFDTNSDYNTSTFRFTPTVAGKYFISASVSITNAVAGDKIICQVTKNRGGTAIPVAQSNIEAQSALIVQNIHASGLVDMNGSTDYVDVSLSNIQRDTSTAYAGGVSLSHFEGFLVQAT